MELPKKYRRLAAIYCLICWAALCALAIPHWSGVLSAESPAIKYTLWALLMLAVVFTVLALLGSRLHQWAYDLNTRQPKEDGYVLHLVDYDPEDQ